jgi:hypothetical protein
MLPAEKSKDTGNVLPYTTYTAPQLLTGAGAGLS